MTERERLIKLLDERIAIQECSFSPDKPLTTDSLADYLLAHGVIVPPCKVGDTVYKVMDLEYTCAQMLESKILRMEIQDGIRFYSKTVKHYRYNYIWFDCTDLGKTVFLTREEAEAALAERHKSK